MRHTAARDLDKTRKSQDFLRMCSYEYSEGLQPNCFLKTLEK
jgi:hypothetical protein